MSQLSQAQVRGITVLFRVLAGIAAIAILIGSLLPSPDYGIEVSDKYIHSLAYLVLAGLLGMSFHEAAQPSGRVLQFLFVWVSAVLFGAFIELVQPVAGRDADVADVLANTAGAAIGTGLAAIAHVVLRPRSRDSRGTGSGTVDPKAST